MVSTTKNKGGNFQFSSSSLSSFQEKNNIIHGVDIAQRHLIKRQKDEVFTCYQIESSCHFRLQCGFLLTETILVYRLVFQCVWFQSMTRTLQVSRTEIDEGIGLRFFDFSHGEH